MRAIEVLAAEMGTDADGRAVLTYRMQERGLRLILHGDAEWSSQLDDLGDVRPLLLWARGAADLRLSCVNLVAIVGSHTATGYNNHASTPPAAV